MGIKNFFDDLKKYFKYKNNVISLDDLKGKIITVDVSILLYKAKYAMSSKNKNPVIRYFTQFIRRFFEIGTLPIMVFDGTPTKLKINTNEERNKKNDGVLKEIKELEEKVSSMSLDSLELSFYYDRISNLKKRISIAPTKEDTDKLKKLFELLSIPYYVVDGHDAENLCSYINKKGYADYIISNDSDVFAFGGMNMIYDYKNYTKSFKCHYLINILSSLKFNSVSQLINYAILVGNDYNKRMKGNGPVTSHTIVHYSKDNGCTECSNLYGNYDDIYDEYTADFSCIDEELKLIKTVGPKKIIGLCKSFSSNGIEELLENDHVAIKEMIKISNLS